MTAETAPLSPAAERILRTAAELIAARGYSATSTRDIASAVGVRQPALYKHFAAKDDILAALVRLGLQGPLELAGALVATDAPAMVKLHRWLRDSLEHLRDSPYVLISILTTPELQQDRFDAERELLHRFDRVVVDWVTEGLAEGEVRPMNPVSGARLVQALFDALALPEIAVSPAEIVEFALTGLLADAGRLPDIRAAAEALPLP
ncbi:TetR/AcrR family transcriptional regulator [Nocardia puris]|uniref:TetR family transcriptional regulator n=1 Tax=Nocardia puris TaxID=208602 RepID=A0A366DUB8_9NOCA|nr:TetR/AcrR family transcriptional regulator [Nocardia puris]MBF6210268.1 TetR/AcrR family transcriptional regulator [Nocardia puris]MBF6367344.1 TetR/AcrR family transcriptional regulator [Nocardia puris]MBF6457529.1 TetR/AcrR family transcriptional regulator [Nocardia puris]RBO93686.1 TetR family transcriptional regulator [Nocardia puris]